MTCSEPERQLPLLAIHCNTSSKWENMPRLLRSNPTESKEKVGNSSIVSDLALVGPEGRVGFRGLFENKFLLGISLFSTLGGFLCGYGLGVLSGVLTIESFGATFPEIYMNPKLKRWLVSTFVLAAWFGATVSGPVCDKVRSIIGRDRTNYDQLRPRSGERLV